MMTDQEFSKWCAAIGLTPEGMELGRLIRTSNPSRRSRGHTNNVRGRYPSRKMGHTVEFDSHTCELHFIYQAEHDPKILEYWEQPPPIKIMYELKGRRRGQQYIADFAVFMEERLIFVECKPEDLLIRKAGKMPGVLFKDEGVWRWPAIEQALAARGIGFLVWTPESAPTYSRNLNFLQDYYLHGFTEVPQEITTELIRIVAERRRIRLNELPALVKGLTNDHLNALIFQRRIFVDLYKDVLAHRHNVWVYPDKETAQAICGALACVKAPEHSGPIPVTEEIGEVVKWGDQLLSIVMLTKDMVHLRKGDKPVDLPRAEFDKHVAAGTIQGSTRTGEHPVVEEVTGAIVSKPTKDIEQALNRLKIVEGGPTLLCERQVRRLVKAARLAREEFGSEIRGLLPNHDAKGNRTPKLPEPVYAIADEVINDVYQTPTAPSKRAAHTLFRVKCEAAALAPASYPWFAARILTKDHKETLEAREGRRAAYSKFGFNYRLWVGAPPHGDHNWDVGHIDHTKLDIEATLTGGNLRAWLTTFWLSFPRLLVARWLHFACPSKIAAMAVIRMCLEKYGRIPTWLVVDNGKEFLGADFQVLLADLGSGVKYRPPHQARSGSVLESAWHALNAHLIHNLPGNTKLMRNVRQVTKSVLPANLARLSLTQIDHKVGAYYDICNDVLHPALEDKPNNYYARHLQLLGERGHMFRPWTPELYILTLPSLGTRRVQPQGVKYMYFNYYNNILANHQGKELEVRYDPLDITHVYVLVEKTWVRCTCPHLADKAARSEAQLKLATVAMRANIGGVIKHREMDMAMRVLPYLELMPAEPTITPVVEIPTATNEVKYVPPVMAVEGPPDTVDTSRQSGSSDSIEKQPEGRKNRKRTLAVLPTEDL